MFEIIILSAVTFTVRDQSGVGTSWEARVDPDQPCNKISVY